MDQRDMIALREIFERGRIVLAFNGPFSQTVIEELGQALRGHLESQTQPRKRIADVFAVYIEMTQNIRHYAEREGLDPVETARLNAGTVVIAAEEDCYVLVSGNLVRHEHVAGLSERLDAVTGLDPAALKAAYKERLRAPVQDGAAGAGLGILQMARKTVRPMAYNVADAGPDHAFFTLSVYI